MFATVEARFRTADVCRVSGHYEFDGYLDGSSERLPALEEMEIRLRPGELFPGISKAWRPCFWRLAGLPAAMDDDLASEALLA